MSVSELSSKHFQVSQLPHSLGGSYLPGTAAQRTTQTSRPLAAPSRTQQPHHHNGETAASGVNTIVRTFQGGHVTPNASPTMSGGGVGGSGPGPGRPPPPSTHGKMKPLPPTKATKSSPMPPPKVSGLRENSNPSQPPAVFKKPSFHGSSAPHGNGDVSQSQRGEGSKPKLPMLPRLGAGAASKASSIPSQQQQQQQRLAANSKLGSPTRAPGVKGHSGDKSSEGAGGGGVASRIQQFQKKTISEDWHGATSSSLSGWGGQGGDERTRSGSAGSQSSPSPSHSRQGSPSKAQKKPLIPVKLLPSAEKDREREREKEREKRGKETSDRQTRGSVSGGVSKGERERVSPRVPPPHNPHNPHSHTHSQQQVQHYAVAMTSANHSADATDGAGGEYENVTMPEPTGGRGHQQAPPPKPTAYENVSIKPSPKLRGGPAHQRAHPHQSQSTSRPVQRYSIGDQYENVDFSPLPLQSSQRHGPAPSAPAPVPRPSPSEEHVMDDDDTLFGKEGPPGMKREEVIYENFGPDDGNRLMTVEEMERHINKKDRKGLSAEYLRIKNEPLSGNYKACRLVM